MKISIILNAWLLSKELDNLINHCVSFFKPNHIYINTSDQAIMTKYADQNLIKSVEFWYIDFYELVDEIKDDSDIYIILDTVDPILFRDPDYLSDIYEEFINSEMRYGIIINPTDNLISLNNQRIPDDLYIINPHLLMINHKYKTGNYYFRRNEKLNYVPTKLAETKVVIITGILGGIGRGVADKYKNEDWTVIGIDYKLDSDKNSLDEKNLCDYYYDIDLSQNDISTIIKDKLGWLDRVDLIVHLAAIQICGKPEEVDLNRWDSLFNVNVKSIYVIAREMLDKLKQSQGSVIIISSVHAYQSSKDISMYAISKSALSGVIRNLAIDWGQYGIRVNGVAPGAILTPMLKDGLSRGGSNLEEALDKLAGRHLMGRIGMPWEIAELVYFLGDKGKSSNITGQTIMADGGATIYLSTEVD